MRRSTGRITKTLGKLLITENWLVALSRRVGFLFLVTTVTGGFLSGFALIGFLFNLHGPAFLAFWIGEVLTFTTILYAGMNTRKKRVKK